MNNSNLSPQDRAERVALYGLLLGEHTLGEIREQIADEIRGVIEEAAKAAEANSPVGGFRNDERRMAEIIARDIRRLKGESPKRD